MANGEAMPALSQSYPMSGGDGPRSYVHNSSYQRAAIDSTKKKIKEAILTKFEIKKSNFDFNSVLKIADFGCSVGSNTFMVIQNIIESIDLKFHKETHQNPKILEFQIFFNDQIDNDFNTLFKTLPLNRKYFVAGAPGSFYGRVFPKGSLHLGHTSYTLHWLSKAPKEISVRNSPAWNKNSIQCTNLVKEVEEAYEAQFKSDMEAFLSARAQELVPGGLMVVVGQCLPDGVPMARTWKGVVTDIIGSCLIDMAKKGQISEEKAESFNLPIYFPHMSELKATVEENGCFSIEIFEKVSHPMEIMGMSNQFIASKYRAIFHGVIEDHFGYGIVDEVFDLFAKKLDKNKPDFEECDKDMQYFMLLKRNIY